MQWSVPAGSKPSEPHEASPRSLPSHSSPWSMALLPQPPAVSGEVSVVVSGATVVSVGVVASVATVVSGATVVSVATVVSGGLVVSVATTVSGGMNVSPLEVVSPGVPVLSSPHAASAETKPARTNEKRAWERVMADAPTSGPAGHRCVASGGRAAIPDDPPTAASGQATALRARARCVFEEARRVRLGRRELGRATGT
ncbi:MAG: hypothetical protein U1F43_16130 [Myxococcota bacterium]